MRKFIDWLERQSELMIAMIGLLLVWLVAAADMVSPPRVSYTLFYLLLVAGAAWVGGKRVGILLALASTLLMLNEEWMRIHNTGQLWVFFWNSGIRLGMFLFTARVVARLRKLTAGLERQVVLRTAELETEVAEHRRSEAKLRENEDILSALLNAVQESLLLLDSQGIVLAVNETGARRLRKPVKELVGSSVFEHLPREVAVKRKALVEESRRTRSPIRVEDVRGDTHFESLVYPVLDAEGQVTKVAIFGLDVTERKQAEEASRESETRFRQVTEAITEVFWMSDLSKNQLVYISPGYEKIWGRTCESLIQSPRDWMEAVHPEDRTRVLQAAVTKQTLGQYDEEYRIVRRDGSERWIRDRAFPVRDASGAVYRIAGISEDITERKRAEEVTHRFNQVLETQVRDRTAELQAANTALRASEELFRTLADQSPTMIFINQRGRVVYANLLCARIMGYPRETLQAPDFDFLTLIAPDSVAAAQNSFRQHQQGADVPPYECALITQTGQRLETIINTKLITYHGEPAILGVVTDITERKRTELQLKQREALLRTAFDNAPFEFWVRDHTGVCIMENEALVKNWGSALGKRPEDSAASPEVLADWQSKNQRALAGEVVRGEVEFGKDAAHRWIYNVIAPFRVGGQIQGIVGLNLDITERKQAEEALHQSEKRSQVILNATTFPIFLLDLQGKVLMANVSAALGLGRALEDLVGEDIFSLLPAAIGSARREQMEKVIRSGHSLHFEDARAGRYFDSHVHPLLNERGEVNEVAVFVVDITERKRAEEEIRGLNAILEQRVQQRTAELETANAALRESVNFNDALIGTSPVGISVYRASGECLLANEALAKLTGGTRDQLQKQSFRKLAGWQKYGQLRLAEQVLKTGQAGAAELDTVTTFGGEIIADFRMAQFTHGGEPHLLVMVQDITERKRAEESLRKSEARWRMAAEAAQMGVWERDLKTDRLYWSATIEQFCGYAPGTFPGTNQAFLELLHPDSLAVHAAGQQRVRTGDGVVQEELHFRLRDGRERWGLVRGQLVRNPQGEPERILGVAIDITERKQAEAGLRETEERLRIALEAGGMVTWEINPATGHIHYADNLPQIVRGTATAPYCERHAVLNEIHPDDRAGLSDAVEQFITNSVPFEREYRAKMLDGEYHWILGKGKAMSAGPGQPARLVGISLDITERKQAEAQLQLQRDLATTLSQTHGLPTALDHIMSALLQLPGYDSGGIYLLDRRTGGLGLKAHRGLSPKFVETVAWYPPESPPLALLRSRRFFHGLPADLGPDLAAGIDREKIAGLTVAALYHEGNLIGSLNLASHRASETLPSSRLAVESLAAIIAGAIARIQAEQTIQLQAMILENLTEGVVVTDEAGRITMINQSLAGMWGGAREELLGQPASILSGLPEAEAAVDLQRTLKSLNEVGHLEQEFLNRRKDGSSFWIEAHIRKLSIGDYTCMVSLQQDVTEQKKTAQKLARSEQRYRALAESSPDAVFILNREIKVDYVNGRAAGLWGRSPDQLVGRAQEEIFPPDTAQRHREIICRVFADGQPYSEEDSHPFPSGVRWLETRLVPLLDQQGAVESVMGVSRDITERKKAEEALRESENRFRAVFESSTDCILVWDRHYNYLYANQAAIDHVGTTRDKVIGKNIRDGLGHVPDFMQLWMRRVDQAFATSESFRVEDAIAVGGRLVYSESQVSPIRDAAGQVFAVGVVYRDVSERKRIEQSLQLQAHILKSMVEGVQLADEQGIICLTNPATDAMYGYQTGALIGKHIGLLSPLPPEDHASMFQELARIIQAGGTHVGEFRSRKKDGTEFVTEAHISRLVFAGQPYTIAVRMDITQRKQLERQVLEISDREQARIGQDIHDGLCQQLISAAFDANLLAQELASDSRSEAARARRLGAVLDTAITEARHVSRGLYPIKLESDGLASALHELAQSIRHRSNIRCTVEIPAPVLIENITMATQLYRIAQEAVTNAIRHARPRHIRLRLKTDADRLELRVTDDGVGLPPAHDDTAGMGLHIMKYRARAIGGTFQARRRPSGGTVVSCCVPLPTL